MAEILSEIKWENWVGQPLENKNKPSTFLEEQIRDTTPCDVETKEEDDEKL
jgi:hypothetical protein